MRRVMDELLDWREQFKDYKTLILTGSTAEDRTAVIKQFALEFFRRMIHINLATNEKIRNYIMTMPVGRDAWYFIEKAVIDMIVPDETLLIFDNAHACGGQGIWDYARSFFTPEDESFLAVLGDFSEEELEAASEYCIIVRLPEKTGSQEQEND